MERWATGLIAIGAAIGLAIVLFFLGRSVNRPPVIEKVDVQPGTVKIAESALLRVAAKDPDGDALRFEFKADTGKVVPDATRPNEARYSPAATSPVADRVHVSATDARGLTSTMDILVSIEGGATPTPVPTEEPTMAPVMAASPPPALTRTAPPTRPPTPPPPAPPPASAATPKANRPPVLQEGTTITDLGEHPIVLVASGHEPDGDPVTFSWDFGPCLQGSNVTQFEAEVKLVGECSYAVATVTWTDPQGASASAQWTIHR